jgi:hypothetical protein
MAQIFDLWCHIEGDQGYFLISISSSKTIYHLIEQISTKEDKFFTRIGCRDVDLTLVKVRHVMISM